MRSRVLAAFIILTAACGEDPTIAPSADARPRPDGEPFPDGGPADGPDAQPSDAGPGDAEPLADVIMDPLGPDNVQVLDPDDADEIIAHVYQVRCQADADATSGSPVERIDFEVIDSTGFNVAALGQPAGGNTYTANVNLSNMTNGGLTVRCIATAVDGTQAGDDNVAFVDMGPRVTVISPAVDAFVHGNIPVTFAVSEFPIKLADTGAAISSVTAQIAGRNIPLTMSAGLYTALVATDDPVIFPIPVVGPAQFHVTATDVRGAVREVVNTFTVDDTPPTIVIDSPAPGELVGGVITVEATITDPAGVNPASVVAVFGNGATMIADFPLFPTTGDHYVGSYDSRALRDAVAPSVLVVPTLSVRAADAVGNEGNTSEVVIMDYTPPLASLDPPVLREAQEDETGTLICSLVFDPLGDDATNDGQAIAQLSEFRARIEDRANTALSTSDTLIFAAGVNDATVQLLVLDNTDASVLPSGDALLVDTDGDTFCDEVNPLLTPTTIPMTSSDALAINMVGIDAVGESMFDLDNFLPDYPACFAPDSSPDSPPLRLCPPTGLQRVIKPQFGVGHVIYGIPPVGGLICMGLPFDSVANNIADGWACVAVRVEDNLGNVGISKPIRVCVDHDGNGAEGCPALPTYPAAADVTFDPTDVPVIPLGVPPADCTGTYNSVTGTVNASAACLMPNASYQFPLTGETRRTDL